MAIQKIKPLKTKLLRLIRKGTRYPDINTKFPGHYGAYMRSFVIKELWEEREIEIKSFRHGFKSRRRILYVIGIIMGKVNLRDRIRYIKKNIL